MLRGERLLAGAKYLQPSCVLHVKYQQSLPWLRTATQPLELPSKPLLVPAGAQRGAEGWPAHCQGWCQVRAGWSLPGWDPAAAGHSAPWVLTARELLRQELGALLA